MAPEAVCPPCTQGGEEVECGELADSMLRSPLKDGPFWVKLAAFGYLATVAWLAKGRTSPSQARSTFLARAAFFGVVAPSAMMATFVSAVYMISSRSKNFSQKFASVLIPVCCGCMIDWKFKKARLELLRGIKGVVLDVGCGSGPYLQYYVQSRKGGGGVTKVVMIEPNEHLHRKLRQSVQEAQALDPGLEVTVRGGYLDSVVGENVFDSIVFGNVLCEVPDQGSFLKDIGRLLKPGGRVYFSEHVGVKPKDSFYRRAQEAINPYWNVFSDGCNINRDTVDTIKAQPWVEGVRHWGFDMDKPMGRMELGIATKKGT